MPRRIERNLLSISPSSSSSDDDGDLNPSLLVIALILIGVFLASLIIHLLLRYITRLSKSAPPHNQEPNNNQEQEYDYDDDDDDLMEAPLSLNQIVHSRSSSRVQMMMNSQEEQDDQNQKLIESLPLFSFESVTGLKSSASADCAVCLSKFEPHDQLRLLPICCHAFHSDCIDTWLSSNTTCPLCRSTVNVANSEDYLKLFAADLPPSRSSSSISIAAAGGGGNGNDSFRIEIGSVSRRRISPLDQEEEEQVTDDRRPQPRSYSMGSFEYVVDDESEVVVENTHRRRGSFGAKIDLSAPVPSTTTPNPQAPGSEIAGEVGEGRGWLRDYVDKLTYSSSSSLSRSFRFSGRFFTGSNRMSEGGLSRSGRRSVDIAAAGDSRGGSWDLEGNRYGEEVSNFFRWLSGV